MLPPRSRACGNSGPKAFLASWPKVVHHCGSRCASSRLRFDCGGRASVSRQTAVRLD